MIVILLEAFESIDPYKAWPAISLYDSGEPFLEPPRYRNNIPIIQQALAKKTEFFQKEAMEPVVLATWLPTAYRNHYPKCDSACSFEEGAAPGL